ncbi:MAG: hypothetical protein JWL91_893 [Sphingomonas bacterium]|nr:serine hydrolase domain-containing protein [Sphingomonas bacterium]MDB5689017.1 hypothetical protein [Sphingomonas bacterium]
MRAIPLLRASAAAIAAAGVALPLPAQGVPAVDAVFARWAGTQSPGCAVMVARDGRTVLNRAYGSADLEHGVANTPGTVFEAGSVSKQFTAAATLALAAQGKLKLDDDVRKHLPEMPDYGARITIDHLLNHTSGLRDWGAVMSLAGWPRTTRAYTQEDVLEIVARQKSLNYLPGTEYSYTNSGYNLLAIIVERVSGQSLADFTAAQFFRPLGMADTGWRDNFRAIVPGRAIAYRKAKDGYEQLMPFEDTYGNGGLLTTTADLMRWNEALTSGRLDPFVTAELQRPARLSDGTPIGYARGLFVSTYRGQSEVWHSGTTAGYKAWLGRWPGERLSLAMLCNAGEIDSTLIAHRTIDAIRGLPAPVVSGSVPAAGRTGLFVDTRSGMPMTFVAKDGALAVEGGAPLGLLPSGRADSPSGEIAFTAAGFDLFDGEKQRLAYRREQPWTPAATELVGLAGRYASEEADAAYVASLSGGKLVLSLDRRPQVRLTLTPAYRDAFAGKGMIVRIVRGAGGVPVGLGLGSSRVRNMIFLRTPS